MPNLNIDNLCKYPPALTLLKGNIGNALPNSEIGKHNALMINSIAHLNLVCNRWIFLLIAKSFPTMQKLEINHLY
jgi:hypothetical protein